MMSIATFSELIACLHAAPLEEENWQRFLLCEYTQTASGYLLCQNKALSSPQILAGGGANFDPESLRLYNAHYAIYDPYVAPYNRNPRIGVIHGDELVPREQLKKTEFFHD
jgi:hypothetical protein